MKLLLQAALTGWTTYTQQGKFAALLLFAILYLGFGLCRNKTKEQPRRILYGYAVLSTIGCIFPVTASLLMKYQTTFYSYVWIWATVPQTAMIAWAATDFLDRLWENRNLSAYLRNTVATVILFGVLFLSGNPVSEWTENQTTQIPEMTIERMTQQKQENSSWDTLEALAEYHAAREETQEFCLWAPKDIMMAARAYSADIRPVYGRSIWDASLGSYSFDTYASWQEELYLWMSHLEDTGETAYLREDRKIDFAACLDSVKTAGADYILLPGNLPEETVMELQDTVGGKLQILDGYFLIQSSDLCKE